MNLIVKLTANNRVIASIAVNRDRCQVSVGGLRDFRKINGVCSRPTDDLD